MSESNYTLKLTLPEANFVRKAVHEKYDRDAAKRPEGVIETPVENAQRHGSVLQAEGLLRRLG